MSVRSLPRSPFWTPSTLWTGLALVAIGLAAYAAGLGRQEIVNPGGLPQLWRFCRASLQPDLSPEFLHLAGRAALITLAYAICGTTLSLLLGFVGGILTSEVWWQSWFPRRQSSLGLGLRGLLAIPRAIHELVWGLFFVNLFGLDPLVAVLAIALPYGAIVAKVFSELLDETPRQPLLALLNSGVPATTAFLYALLPQAALDLLSYGFYRFECSIRSAAVLGIIGAGGLGYEILLSLQSLRYQQLWTLFYALVLLSGAVDASSALLRQRLGAPSRLTLHSKSRTLQASAAASGLSRSVVPPRSRLVQLRQRLWQQSPAIAVLAALVLIPGSFWLVKADFSKLWSPRSAQLLAEIGASVWPLPISGATLSQLGLLSLQTLAMSVLAIALAGAGGLLLSFPAAHNFFLPGGLLSGPQENPWRRLGAWIGLLTARCCLLLCRAIPAPIWALVALFVLFPVILPGAIALGVHNLGILGRLLAEAIENLDQRPLSALKAQGTPAALVFLYGVLPLTLTRFLAYVFYRWEVCLRETVIVGLVGAGGLGRLLTEQLSSFDYSGILLSLGCFILLTFAVDWVSHQARRSLR